MKKNKIFIACDTNKIIKTKEIINKTKTTKIQIGYKFGLEFINSKKGREFISKLKRKIIFLDLKLNDIPNTCVSTIKTVKDLKANYITIHISSGLEALKAVKKVSGRTKIVGVSTLTSLNEKSLKEIGYDKKLNSLVVHQAKLASKAKLDALVCSSQEAKSVKKVFKKEIITPGIRFNSKTNDQKRVMSATNAFKTGSDWLVIGRPITKGNIKKNLQKLIDHLKND
jgi:orotidine-5'-phosphate decarboxylase|tara:strand:- start:7534 stop:8211 length:678 start_codon:yes stop_codon:yes gene_type:complete